MTRLQSNLILTAVAVLVTSLGIAGYFAQRNRDENITPRIISEVIIPYSDAIKNKEYEFAYQNLTTDEYKQKYSYDEYLAAQKLNNEKYGELIDIKPLSGIFLTQKGMHKPWRFVGTLRYRGLKKQERVQIEIARDQNGKFLINNTFLSLLQYDSRSNEPMVF